MVNLSIHQVQHVQDGAIDPPQNAYACMSHELKFLSQEVLILTVDLWNTSECG